MKAFVCCLMKIKRDFKLIRRNAEGFLQTPRIKRKLLKAIGHVVPGRKLSAKV